MAPPPDYRQIAAQKAKQYGVPVDVFLRQIGQESGFRPDAHSSAGADGIAQFIPSTAKAYGVNTRDPVSSLDGAARYDAALLKQYGSIARALSAYNSGRPDAYKDPNFAKGQTYNYVKSILSGTTPGGGGAGASPAPAAGTPAPAAPLAAQPVDRTPQLLSALTGAGDDNYAGFYQQLGSALRARNNPVAVQPPVTPQAAPVASALAGKSTAPGGFAELLHEGLGGPTHSTGEHIHFASTDPQKELQAIKLAQSLGLNVRENPYTDPVDPVHAKNSYHYRTFPGKYNGRSLGEAADASGDKATMLKLYKLLGGH